MNDGHISDAEGLFKLREQAFEAQYFNRLVDEQLTHLHEHHLDEIQFLEKQIADMEVNITRRKVKLQALKSLKDMGAKNLNKKI
jgi:hypothetical protein